MQSVRYSGLRSSVLCSAMLLCAAVISGCGSKADPSVLGTFRMGEKVQVGPMVYTVLEAQWKNSLTDTGTAKPPQNRYLFVRVSCTNGGAQSQPVPAMQIQSTDKKTYNELTEGLTDVPNWFGILRTVPASQTEQGYVIFDAPLGAYKLLISNGGDIGSEKYAQVELPVQFD